MSTTKKQKRKDRKKTPAAVPTNANPGAVPERKPRRWFRWLLAAAFLFIAASLTYGLIDYVLFPRIPAELVGTWRVQGGPQNGVILHFDRNGDFEARYALGDKQGGVHARAEIDSSDHKKLRIVSTNSKTGRRMTKIHIIRSLTESEMLLEDPTGTVSRLIRLE